MEPKSYTGLAVQDSLVFLDGAAEVGSIAFLTVQIGSTSVLVSGSKLLVVIMSSFSRSRRSLYKLYVISNVSRLVRRHWAVSQLQDITLVLHLQFTNIALELIKSGSIEVDANHSTRQSFWLKSNQFCYDSSIMTVSYMGNSLLHSSGDCNLWHTVLQGTSSVVKGVIWGTGVRVEELTSDSDFWIAHSVGCTWKDVQVAREMYGV